MLQHLGGFTDAGRAAGLEARQGGPGQVGAVVGVLQGNTQPLERLLDPLCKMLLARPEFFSGFHS
jgi:hypothetical protein